MIFPPGGDADRTLVKICGVTHPDDAALCAELGADALGLNFYPGSPRCLDPARDGDWLRALPVGVWRVAVVVNLPREGIRRLIGEGWADSVQLHGDEDEAFCLSLLEKGISFARAIRVRDAGSLAHPERFHTTDLVLDAYRADAYGGTGHTLDWPLAAEFAAAERTRGRRTILSGGLHPGNVAGAVASVRPAGVDVASGVEARGNPRRKDPARVREFIAAAKGE